MLVVRLALSMRERNFGHIARPVLARSHRRAEVPPRVPDAISNLRRATNYLTPVKGILSPDTWATITIVGRNLILNHLVIVPLIAALLVIVKLVGAVAHEDRLFAGWENWSQHSIGNSLEPWLADQSLGSLLLPGVFVGTWLDHLLDRSPIVGRPAGHVAPPVKHQFRPGQRQSPCIRSRKPFTNLGAPLGHRIRAVGSMIFGLMAANDIPRGELCHLGAWMAASRHFQ